MMHYKQTYRLFNLESAEKEARSRPTGSSRRVARSDRLSCLTTKQSILRLKGENGLMSKVFFITGDFCSGTTLLFTLFRKTGEYYSLYEPLHSLLRENLIWPLRAYEHHFFVDDYFAEKAVQGLIEGEVFSRFPEQ